MSSTCLQLPAERKPVHPGHADVEHNHIGTDVRDARLGLRGAAGLVDVDVDVFEGGTQQGAEPWIVVYQQQAHRYPPDRML